MRRLLVVGEVYEIEGRGLVLWPGLALPRGVFNGERDDHAEVRHVDGARVPCVLTIAVEIMSRTLESVRRGDPVAQLTPMLTSISKEDVPKGSEVWASDGLVHRVLEC